MQSVFEKIKERLEESGKEIYREPTVKDPPGCSLIPTGEKDLLVSKAIEIVNQVAEEYGDGWIPCSEKTPEFEKDSVTRLWVTIHRKGCDFCFTSILRWNEYQGGWEWDNGKMLSDTYEVVAWKQFDVPVPYNPNIS